MDYGKNTSWKSDEKCFFRGSWARLILDLNDVTPGLIFLEIL